MADITGDATVIHGAANALGKVSTDVLGTVKKEPDLPEIGAKAAYSGKVGPFSNASVAFPEADTLLAAFQAAHQTVVDGVTFYGNTVGVQSTATHGIANEYANTLDHSKIGADQINQALNT